MKRRDFIRQGVSAGILAGALPLPIAAASPDFRLTDVSESAGIQFRQNNGSNGGKLLPETLGSGCAFLDYDADGWQDILLVNGMDWPGHKRQRATMKRRYQSRRSGRRDVWYGRSRRRLQQ